MLGPRRHVFLHPLKMLFCKNPCIYQTDRPLPNEYTIIFQSVSHLLGDIFAVEKLYYTRK